MPSVTAAPPGLVDSLRDRYAIERELGCGGMATVYLANDLRHSRAVALKVLRPDLVPVLGAERFEREIRIASRLRHPNLLPVLDSGVAGGVPYYVTPYVEGDSLANRLKREGQLPIADAVEIAGQIADALHAVHSEGFVHRDVKPSNILLAKGGAILADLGIARAVDVVTAEKMTETGVALGTPAYMSPEQSGCGIIDGRSDIYSLGCVVFEMLAGAPPFTGPTVQSVHARHALDPMPSLHTVRITVSATLEQTIAKAMAKVPADRYAGVLQFKEALQRAAAAEPLVVTAPSARRRRKWPLLAGLAGLAAAALATRLVPSGPGELDRNRVMVYPLVASGNVAGRRTIGEDVATLIGNALDGTGPLRWIDAWPLLDPGQRNDIRALSLSSARGLARSRRCAYYLNGRLVERGDSADVLLELNDVRGDSTIARGKASGLAADAWRLGLQAVNHVLPKLIPGVPRDLTDEWSDRDPAAVASLLLGEAAFRRVHLPEALAHYRDAITSDPTFGLAAIRGAQAATWNHRPLEAAAFVRTALSQPLPPRYLHFTRGYEAYLGGWADSAAAEFRRALALDPAMTVAWVQLGEVYTHLLPAAGKPDSLAEAAFEQAQGLDSTASNLLLHLIEHRLRKGDTAGAAPLIHGFLATDPDIELAAQVRLMEACVRRGPGALDWREAARTTGLALLSAGNSLKGSATLLPCAMSAFIAVIEADTTSAGELRWFALLGLQSALLAQGRTEEAIAWIDAPEMHGDGASMYLLDAPLYPELAGRARKVAMGYRQECGGDYHRCSNPVRLWELGIWEAHEGRPDVADAVARDIASRVPRPGMPREKQVNPSLANSLAGHAALARGDTAAALRLFRTSLGEPLPGEYLTWDVASPRALDRLRLAQLLVARGEFREAIDVASVFESAWPSVHLLYLPASLALRAEAASAAGDAELATQYRDRLAALTTGTFPAVRHLESQPNRGVS